MAALEGSGETLQLPEPLPVPVKLLEDVLEPEGVSELDDDDPE